MLKLLAELNLVISTSSNNTAILGIKSPWQKSPHLLLSLHTSPSKSHKNQGSKPG